MSSLFRFQYVIEYKRNDPMNRVAEYFKTERKKLVNYVRSRIDDAAVELAYARCIWIGRDFLLAGLWNFAAG